MHNLNRFRSKIFRALSDAERIEILDFLREEERCVCDIVRHFKVRQPLISRQLSILKACGLVKQRGAGTRRYYSVTDPRVFELIDVATIDLVDKLSKRAIEQITA